MEENVDWCVGAQGKRQRWGLIDYLVSTAENNSAITCKMTYKNINELIFFIFYIAIIWSYKKITVANNYFTIIFTHSATQHYLIRNAEKANNITKQNT